MGKPVLKILGLSQHPETHCFLMVMPFATCGTFDHSRQSSDRNWTDFRTIALNLAVSLHHIHSLGFCHNDLHAGNVILHDNRHAELIDVGITLANSYWCTSQGSCNPNTDGLREDLIPGSPAWFNEILRDCWKIDR